MHLRAIAAVAIGFMVSSEAMGQNLLDSDPGPLDQLGQPTNPTYNNPSFEHPDVASVAPSVSKWVASGPALFVPGFGNILAGVGVFENPPDDNPVTPEFDPDPARLAGTDGTQIAYLFANSFADFNDGQVKDHTLTQVTQLNYLAGEEYRLTVALTTAGSPPPPNSILTLSLFAVDSSAPGGEIPIASSTVQNDGSTELNGEYFVDFSATSAAIAGDAIGKPIGMRIFSHTAPASPAISGQWNVDNVRLTIVPEPASLALVGLAGAGVLARRRRAR